MGLADKVTWVGVGNVDTMLGSLKTKQIDVLSSAISVTTEAEKNGWGKVIYSPSDEKIWNSVIGGPVPVNVNFCLTATIEKEPEKVQAFTNAIWRAHAVDQGQQPGEHPGHHRALRRLDLARRQPARDRRAQGRRRLERPDHAGVLRPRREGLVQRAHRHQQPIKLEDAVADKFLKAAHAKYPA